MSVIGANDNTSVSQDELKARGVAARANIDIVIVFKDGGDLELSFEAGARHAELAMDQARAVGQAEGTAIYFSLEHLPGGYRTDQLAGLRAYLTGVRHTLNGRYKLGCYSDGVVCKAVQDEQLCDYAWLSPPRELDGSADF
jgi:hypothetical protein